MIAQPVGNAELRYTHDEGWYAWMNGRCIQSEIDGTLASARAALVAARPARGGSDRQPVDLDKDERQAEKRFYFILYAGGAGSAEFTEAYTVWMAARTARATRDANAAAWTF